MGTSWATSLEDISVDEFYQTNQPVSFWKKSSSSEKRNKASSFDDTMPICQVTMVRNYHKQWTAGYISRGNTVHDVVQPYGGQLSQGFSKRHAADITDAVCSYSFNKSAITIAHHPEFHACTKHIDIALHFLQDHMNKGTLNMFYIKTNYNIADIFTKALTQPIHQNFTYKLGIILVKWEC